VNTRFPPQFRSSVLRFGEFELDVAAYALRRDGQRVTLRPQPFRALLLLAQHADRVVTREELRQAIWPGEVVVDFEHGLNTCVRQIRAALGDDADDPRYVETVPRVGYRFIAPVDDAPAAGALPHHDIARRTGLESQRVVAPQTPRWVLAAAFAALVAAGIVTLLMTARVNRGAHAGEAATAIHEKYVRGLTLLDSWTPGGVRTALGIFEQIVAEAPAHAPSHAGIVEACLQRPYGLIGLEPEAAVRRARQALDRALALASSSPEPHGALAAWRLRQRDWAGAGEALGRATQLGPKNARIRAQRATWLVLQGRFDEALAEARTAEALDPLSPSVRYAVASVLRYSRRFEEAIAQATRTLELDPNFGPAHYTLGHAHLAQGRLDAAIDAFRRSGGPSGNLGHAYGRAGRMAEAREVLSALEQQTHVDAGAVAQVLIGLGDYDAAFAWLARAVDQGNGFTLKTASVWDPLRGDPRFPPLLQRAGFHP
jgi:DNA-binding winged helix-turn-helix (wHTH) protein/tetratricopeptide (TPR) repeat protein